MVHGTWYIVLLVLGTWDLGTWDLQTWDLGHGHGNLGTWETKPGNPNLGTWEPGNLDLAEGIRSGQHHHGRITYQCLDCLTAELQIHHYVVDVFVKPPISHIDVLEVLPAILIIGECIGGIYVYMCIYGYGLDAQLCHRQSKRHRGSHRETQRHIDT
jgi:hypothetical protein